MTNPSDSELKLFCFFDGVTTIVHLLFCSMNHRDIEEEVSLVGVLFFSHVLIIG